MKRKRTKKLVVLLACICVWLCCADITVYAAQDEAVAVPLEEYLLEEEWAEFFARQPVSFSQLRGLRLDQLIQVLWDLFCDQLQAPARLMLRVLAVLLFLGLFRALCKESTPPELDYTLQSVLSIVLFLLLSEPVLELVEDFVVDVERCRVFLAQFVPVLGSILTVSGQTGTAAVYSTVFFSVIMAISQILSTVVSPLIRAFLAVSVTRGMSGSLQLDGILSLLRKAAHWIMGLTATVFGAYLGFQSVLANAADSLAMKAGRFVLAGGVPIVGGVVSDAIGTVYTGLRLVKSAAGAVGIAALLLLFVPGLISCAIYGFLCRGCAAAAQLMDNAPAKGLLEGVADSIAMLQAVRVLYMMLTILATALVALLHTGGV